MLKKYLKQYKLLVCISIVLVLLQVWSTLAQPDVLADVINELSNANIDNEEVYSLGLKLIIIGLIGLAAGVLNTFVAAKISQGIGAKIRNDGFRKIQTFSFEDVQKFSTSNLVVRLTNDVTQVQNLLMMGFQMLLRIPFMFLGAFIMSLIIFPEFWWLIVLYVVIIVIITMFMMKKAGPVFGKIQKGVDQINTTVKENIDGVRVVKSFVTEKDEKEKFDKQVDELTGNLVYTGKIFSGLIPLYMLFANILMAVLVYVTATLALDDPTVIGNISSIISYIMLIMFSIIMAGFLMMTVSRAVVSIKRISEILDTNPSFSYGNDELGSINEIEFKDVSFTYSTVKDDKKGQESNEKENEKTLDKISFTAKKGEKVGIVGVTGSGKTTLVNLIPRLYSTTEGEIKINGKNIENYTAKSLRDNISLVLQKANLFSGTIEENILQGNKNATKEELEIASKRSQALEFIEKKDGKFDAEVYQKGSNFSGGQKQRLSIARGLVKNPEILILDDSTSALDAKSENAVKEVINNELNNTLVFIVAQKISSVVDTDKIIVLNDGKVDAIGTHSELINKSETYKTIYDTQKGKGE